MLLHKEHGVNPRLTFCPQCGGEGNEIVMLGADDGIYSCIACDQKHIGRPKNRTCQACGGVVEFERTVEQHERLPGSICDECQERNRVVEEEVVRGGIYWRCADCGSEGAFRAESPISIAVREQTGIAAPDPVGLEMSQEEGCPVCGQQGGEDDQTEK